MIEMMQLKIAQITQNTLNITKGVTSANIRNNRLHKK